jgi:hypothetical protein
MDVRVRLFCDAPVSSINEHCFGEQSVSVDGVLGSGPLLSSTFHPYRQRKKRAVGNERKKSFFSSVVCLPFPLHLQQILKAKELVKFETRLEMHYAIASSFAIYLGAPYYLDWELFRYFSQQMPVEEGVQEIYFRAQDKNPVTIKFIQVMSPIVVVDAHFLHRSDLSQWSSSN